MGNLEFISTRFPQEVPRGQAVRVRLGRRYRNGNAFPFKCSALIIGARCRPLGSYCFSGQTEWATHFLGLPLHCLPHSIGCGNLRSIAA